METATLQLLARPRAAMARLLLAAALCMVGQASHADALSDIQTLIERGDHAAALAGADRLLASTPREAQPQFQKGVALMGLQRDDEALKVFNDLTQQYPELPDPWNDIALLHARAGRLELARDALLNALRSDPAHRAARANLGQIYLMLAIGQWAEAAAANPLDQSLARRLEAARALLHAAPAANAAR